jgi:hypothetical protein
MRVRIIIVLIIAPIILGQSANIHVRELPPEDIPHGTCTEGNSGYLGVESTGRFKLTEQEIGTYVARQLKEGTAYNCTLKRVVEYFPSRRAKLM